jgi:hypothetical protein
LKNSHKNEDGKTNAKKNDADKKGELRAMLCRSICRIWVYIAVPFVRLHNLKDWTSRILAAATVAIFMTTVLQWWALKDADLSFKRANRAFVYFNEATLARYSPQGTTIAFGLSIPITNSGNTPARSLTVQFACPILPDKSRDAFDVVKWDAAAPMPFVLGPKQTITTQACNFTPVHIHDAKNRQTNIFFVAIIKYEDTLNPGTGRVTQLSQQIDFDSSGGHSFAYVGRHNCSDEDCPK